MFERYPPSSVRALFIARATAVAARAQAIDVEHLVAGAIQVLPLASPFRSTVLQKLDLTVPEQNTASAELEIPFSPQAKRLLRDAMSEADQLGHHRIRPEHLLMAVLAESVFPASGVLREAGVEREMLIQSADEDASRDDGPLRYTSRLRVSVDRHE
jgi:ATP-dependent Clp protease ATP-binding subunit ClpA